MPASEEMEQPLRWCLCAPLRADLLGFQGLILTFSLLPES